MKKIALLLALLLCMVPVLSSCGGANSPEDAVETALSVMYGDGGEDEADYYEVAYKYNLDILDLLDNGDEAAEIKKAVREAQKEVKDSLNRMGDLDKFIEENEYDDFDYNYEIIYCDVYEEKDGENFDNLISSFGYANTDIEDYVTAIAKVGVLTTVVYEKEDEIYTSADVETYTVYEIDGNWYIG